MVGLFDPVFHMYGEDDDLLKRLRQSGGSTRLQPNASIRHYHNDEVAKGSSKYRIIKQKLRSLGILTARYDECSVNTLMSTTAKQMKYCLKSGEPALAFGLVRASIHGYATGRNLKSDLEDRINAALTEDLIGHNLIDQ